MGPTFLLEGFSNNCKRTALQDTNLKSVWELLYFPWTECRRGFQDIIDSSATAISMQNNSFKFEDCLTVHLHHEIMWNANLMQKDNDMFRTQRPSSGALAVKLQHMAFCTEFVDGWWSWEPLRRSCLRFGWCHPNRIHDPRSDSQDHHPSTNSVQKTICCNLTANAPDDGRMRPKHVASRWHVTLFQFKQDSEFINLKTNRKWCLAAWQTVHD